MKNFQKECFCDKKKIRKKNKSDKPLDYEHNDINFLDNASEIPSKKLLRTFKKNKKKEMIGHLYQYLCKNIQGIKI